MSLSAIPIHYRMDETEFVSIEIILSALDMVNVMKIFQSIVDNHKFHSAIVNPRKMSIFCMYNIAELNMENPLEIAKHLNCILVPMIDKVISEGQDNIFGDPVDSDPPDEDEEVPDNPVDLSNPMWSDISKIFD